MRITGGRLRGRKLFAPVDERVRPTADKVRQAIFNMLAHHQFGMGFTLEKARGADLFAGTGAMGIEAISRGAGYCLFVEESAESRALIQKNVETLELTGVTKIWRRDATRLGPMPAGSGGPFDLVFLDPPYRKGLIPPALASLLAGGWLAGTSLVVAETAEDETLGSCSGFQLLDQRVYGDTCVRFLWANGHAGN
jgi:16S rRNA (guanine966-N2)-methyltransferase